MAQTSQTLVDKLSEINAELEIKQSTIRRIVADVGYLNLAAPKLEQLQEEIRKLIARAFALKNNW